MNSPDIWNGNWITALLNHLWQSTLVVAIAWLLAIALRRNNARVRYWVWFAASIKFLLPFSLFIAAGEWVRSLVPAAAAQPVAAPVILWMTQPFVGARDIGSAGSIAPHSIHWLDWVIWVSWACGAFVVAFRFGSAWWKVHATKQAAKPLDLSADVPVLLSPTLIEPGVFGIIHPVLLLPEGILERLSAEQMGAILAHEMCHVRRRDNFTYAIHMIVETLFWFHPAVWWIGARLIEERERACDEAVVEAGGAAETYAEGILNVCKFYIDSPMACVAGVTGADLKKRVAWIMERRRSIRLTLRKKILLGAFVLLVLAAPMVIGLAQSAANAGGPVAPVGQSTALPLQIVGIWQGTVKHDGHDLRMEIKIANVTGGGYTTSLYSIDNGGAPDHATETAFVDGTLTFSVETLNVKFEGKISADGKIITGNWTEGPNFQPLSLTRTTSEAAWPIPEPPRPMAADAKPGFEVVTIKPSKPDGPEKGLAFQGTHFIAFKIDLNDLMALAYGMHPKQILGAPDWFGTNLFDINGKADVAGQPNMEQMGELVQRLLADRFALKFHRERRQIPAYIITVASGGAKLDKTALGPNDNRWGFGIRGPGDLVIHNMDMAEFATGMQSYVMDKPVVDHTGLTGKYDFTLKWAPDDSQFAQSRGQDADAPPGAGANQNSLPSLYTAVQEQLGLKIEAGKTMVDVIVIDHAEKPSQN